MAEKRTESGGTKGQARQREKAASTTTGGNVRNAEAKTTTPLLDINHCTARQLSLIPGVSREVGDRIVATRRRLGGSFQYFDQLHTIKGVTRVVIQALRGRVQVPCEKATSIGEPEGYMRLGPVQSQSSLLSLNSLGDMARRKAEETAAAKLKMKSPKKATPRPSYGGKKSRTPTKQVSTPPRKTVKVQRNLTKTKTPTRSSKIHGKSTKTPATSRARPSNRQTAAKSRLKSPRKPGKSPVSSKRPPTGRLVGKSKTPTKRPTKKSAASASRKRSITPKRATKKSSTKASASKPPRPSTPRRKKAVSVSPQTKKIKTTPRRASAARPRRESSVTYQVVTSPGGKSTWTYPSSRGRASTRQPPVLVLKIETSPTQQQTADTAPADTAVATSKTPQLEVEETSVSIGSRSRRSSKKSANKRATEVKEPSVEVTPGDSASATAGSKTPAVPSTTAGANASAAVEVEKDPARLRSRSSVEAVEKWLESTARYSTDLPQQEQQGDDCSSRHTRQGMEDITSEYKSAYAYPPSTDSAERAKGTQPAQTDSQGWNVAEGNQTQPSPEEPPAAKDAEGNDTQGNEKEPVVVEQVEAGAEVAGTPTGRERRRRHHRHRRSRDEPSPKRRRRSFDSGSYPTCSVL